MPKITQLHVVLLKQEARNRFSAHNFFFPVFKADATQGRVSERMIPELKTLVHPHTQGLDAIIDFSKFVELTFVDEANCRNLLLAKRAQQLGRHFNNFAASHRVRTGGGEIIDGNRDSTLRRGLAVERPRNHDCPHQNCNHTLRGYCTHWRRFLQSGFFHSASPPTLPRSTTIEALGNVKTVCEFAVTSWATIGPSGSAWLFGPSLIHTYCSLPKVATLTSPSNDSSRSPSPNSSRIVCGLFWSRLTSISDQLPSGRRTA